MKNSIKKLSECRTETLIVEVGHLNTATRLFVRSIDTKEQQHWGEWEITTQEQHDYLIGKIDNNRNRSSELGTIYLDMIK